MFNLILSYVFLFLLAGSAGVGIGWLVRDLIIAGPRRALQDEIDDYQRRVAQRNATKPAGAGDLIEFEVRPDA